jgi:radical SAM protein with 4Fe4S-binding SPASM domain
MTSTPAEFFEDSAVYRDHYLDEVPYPKLVMLETSSLCNLRCPMCPRTHGRSPSAGESGKVFGNMKGELLDHLDGLFRRTRSVVLSWFGEPLLNPDLPAIARRLKNYGVSVHLTTNGMLLSRTLADALIDAGVEFVAVSMDAADPETFRRLRAGAELDIVRNNILGLNRRKRERGSATPQVQIAFTVMPENAEQMPAMIRLAHSMGIRHFSIGALDNFALAVPAGLQAGQGLGARERVLRSYREARAAAAELGVSIVLESPARFYHEIGDPPPEFAIEDRFFRNDYTPEQTAALGFRKGCGVPWMDTVIGYNGDVHPCCVSARVLGNVFQQPFEDIWTGPAYRAFRAALKSTKPFPECRDCRRAHWTGSHRLEDLRDAMTVGEHEVHGQGWAPLVADSRGRWHRRVERDSTVFLRYAGQRCLEAELGAFRPRGAACRMTINNRDIGVVRVRLGWNRYRCDVPDLGAAEFAKITLSPADPAAVKPLVRGVRLLSAEAAAEAKRCASALPFDYARGAAYVGEQHLHKRVPGLIRRLLR